MTNKKTSRKKLKADYIKIKNYITEAKATSNVLFFTDDTIDENSQWADFFFLSGKEKTFWNAEIITTKLEHEECVHHAAMDELEKILGANWYDNHQHFNEIIDPVQNTITWEPVELSPLPELGNLTWREWLEKKEKELTDAKTISVCESIEIDKNYMFGRGLRIIKNVENISVDIINACIEEFIKGGEQAYLSKSKITY